MTQTLVIDPTQLNDRLVLGLKRTMSEFEMSLLRQRALAPICTHLHRALKAGLIIPSAKPISPLDSGSEGGIRTLNRLISSVSYRFYVAWKARNATYARNHCPVLPAEGNGILPLKCSKSLLNATCSVV